MLSTKYAARGKCERLVAGRKTGRNMPFAEGNVEPMFLTVARTGGEGDVKGCSARHQCGLEGFF